MTKFEIDATIMLDSMDMLSDFEDFEKIKSVKSVTKKILKSKSLYMK